MANRKLNEILLSGEVDGVKTMGVTPLEMGDPVWLDLLGNIAGVNFDSTRGHVDWNFDQGTLDFDENADISNNRDAMLINYQLNHDTFRGGGAELRPHVHWFQENSGSPYQKIQYRKLLNGWTGADFPVWVDMDSSNFTKKFTYVSGILLQITEFEHIDISDCGLSSMIQFRMWRDGGNPLDTYGSTKVKMLFSDAHYQKYKEGSQDEYAQ